MEFNMSDVSIQLPLWDSVTREMDIESKEKANSPYNMALYLLLIEIESFQQKLPLPGFSADVHAYYGAFMTYLIRKEQMTLLELKCFVVDFIGQVNMEIVNQFLLSIHENKEIGVLPCNSFLFEVSKDKPNPPFVLPCSVIGAFARKIEINYSGLNSFSYREWEKFLNESSQKNSLIFAEINKNFAELCHKLKLIEQKINL